MNIPELATRRPVTVLMAVAVILVLGFISLFRLPIDEMPNMSMPMANVNATYSGATPEVVESAVTKPIEQVLSTINGVSEMDSTSSYGSSMVTLQFNWGTNMDEAMQEIRDKIGQIKNLPDGVETPTVSKMDPNSSAVMEIAMSGGVNLADLTQIAKNKVQPALEQVSGAADVTITGAKTQQVQVLVDPLKLNSYGIALSAITSVLANENSEVSAGTLPNGLKNVTIMSTGKYESLDQIANTTLTTSQGATIHLGDVAEVSQGYADMDQISYLNGRPCVSLSVMKQSGANTVSVSQGVHQELNVLQNELPASVHLVVVSDEATSIEDSINSVKESAVVGGILAVLVIFLFLRNIKTTLVVAASIPISIIATFILLYFSGTTLNTISLGGLSLGVGLIVDDSIVVLECIYRHRQAGETGFRAAVEGTMEVAAAVTSSTLTNVVVFLPILFTSGMAAQIFRDLALAVTFSLMMSLVIAMTLVPTLANRLVDVHEGVDVARNWYERLGNGIGAALEKLHTFYGKLLTWALDHRKTVVVGTLVIFLVSLFAMTNIGMNFFAQNDSGTINITVQMDRGTSLDQTTKVANYLDQKCRSLKEVQAVLDNVGSGGNFFASTTSTDVASMTVVLVPLAQRSESSTQVAAEISQMASAIPGADITVAAQMTMSSNPVSISLFSDDMDTLKSVSDEVVEIVKKVPGTTNVSSSLEKSSPEITVRIDRDKAAAFGLSSYAVAQTVQTALLGSTATTYESNGNDIDVVVRLVQGARQNIDDLENLMLSTSSGATIPLSEIAQLGMDNAPTTIDSENQTRTCTVTADLSGSVPLGVVTQNTTKQMSLLELPSGCTYAYGGQQKSMTDSFSALGIALLLGIVLVYMVMAAQFESLLYPLVIMMTMPLAFIGVVWAFVITGKSFDISAFIGIILLVGIVVKNGIVLVDYINNRRRAGMDRRQAILTAGPVRLRPVLMTALAAILGMVPLALNLGSGGSSDQTLAIAVIGGLTIATFLTLIFVPVMYTIAEDLVDMIKEWFQPLLPGVAQMVPKSGDNQS